MIWARKGLLWQRGLRGWRDGKFGNREMEGEIHRGKIFEIDEGVERAAGVAGGEKRLRRATEARIATTSIGEPRIAGVFEGEASGELRRGCQTVRRSWQTSNERRHKHSEYRKNVYYCAPVTEEPC